MRIDVKDPQLLREDATHAICERLMSWISAMQNAYESMKVRFEEKEIPEILQYVQAAYPIVQVYGWMMNGWRTSGKDDVKNIDLWKELLALTKRHEVTFIKVKGHADNELNNRCDTLARGAIKELQKTIALDSLPF